MPVGVGAADRLAQVLRTDSVQWFMVRRWRHVRRRRRRRDRRVAVVGRGGGLRGRAGVWRRAHVGVHNGGARRLQAGRRGNEHDRRLGLDRRLVRCRVPDCPCIGYLWHQRDLRRQLRRRDGKHEHAGECGVRRAYDVRFHCVHRLELVDVHSCRPGRRLRESVFRHVQLQRRRRPEHNDADL